MTTTIRQIIYAVGTIASGVVTVLLALNVVDAGTAASLTEIFTSVGALLGTGAAATAAVVVTKQRNDGTLDPAPPPPPAPVISTVVPVATKVASDVVADLGPLALQVVQLAARGL